MNLVAAAALLHGLPQAAWLVALDTKRVVAANPAAAALFGRPVQALLSESAEALAASPEDLAWWAAVAAGRVEGLHSDTVLATADGRAVAVSRSIGLVAEGPPGSAPSHALVVLSDRSAEQRAESEREALLYDLQATLEATADGILVTDLAGRVRDTMLEMDLSLLLKM